MPTTTVSTRPRRAIVALATSIAFAAAAAHDASALSLPPSTYQDCAEALLKTSSTLLKKREKAIFQCTDDLLACRLDADLAAGNWAACSAPVAASCESSLAKLQEKEAGVAAKLAKKCGSLADHDFGSSVGLGMRRLLEECGAVTSAPEAYECFLSRLRCAAADIVETVQPRAYEVLQSSGVLTAEADQFACLDVRAPVVPAGGDPVALAECSSGLAAALNKPLLKTPKDLAACVGDLLECRLRADRLQTNRPQPPGCYGESAPASSCAKAEDKLAAALGAEVATAAAESCNGLPAATVLDALGLGDACSSAATLADVATCVQGLLGDRTLLQLDETVPRICQLSTETGQAVFALGEFCAPQCGDRLVRGTESCDDGNLDPNDGCSNSCATGPTEHESHSLPASVHPAHTPDGTMLNAVDPGSSVAVQFGTTTPDLNNVSYVRYHAPGAGDPDAVLVLVPGFAGGAHSLKIVAETMVAKAAAEGSINLEVWTFDRRTDQLEDDGGGELAESEDDPALAIDWYFGGELGLALDSRLSRRAVFHDGADIPFIGNFTYNMFIHDIDDVVDAAHAMPGSPTVFLGGHSLGTLFSARYAATDLDPGVAVVPGHTKVAGLVLFEGGGDSMPIAPPPSDDLDLVIAKHDGGLYHAIRTGAASCWDGTPCPGGDPDCSALALPAGAVTNKCVQPVEAFAGSVISPQIHAVGDAVVVQARRHPDSLSIAQTPFGAQTPIQAVPGLSLLGFLPRGSAEATVGFFLDDDYSPEVSFQASMGFSNNGPNTDLGTYYLAGPAPNDPYRLWMGIDAAMPAAAVVDHGAPSGAFALNGVEDEMTTMANMLTMVRSGDRNIGDWYFPSSGLELTKELIVGVGGFTGGLDSTALSVGRGRPDIENLTEGPGIGIPVICFGGSNGISPTDGAMLPFAESIGPCTAPSCDGTPRVVTSDPIHPAYGDVAGGFESWIGPGYAHIDVVSGEDDAGHAEVYPPLLAFLERNTTP